MACSYDGRIFALTKGFPRDELFGLTAQIRRASLSISSNIAEGSGGDSAGSFRSYLNNAIRSTFETVSQLCIAERRGYITNEEYRAVYDDAEVLVKSITALRNSTQ
jgi:four helix bundle protein